MEVFKEVNSSLNNEKTTIYLIRHGESIGNAKKIFLGHTDLDLTETGYKQAEATANALSDIKFDAIYSSDLQRAYHTALPHAEKRGMAVNKFSDLREIYAGRFENRHIDDIISEFGELFTVDWRQKFGGFIFPDGETVEGAGERMEGAIANICDQHIGGTVLIAAHAAIIRAFVGRILSLSIEEYNVKLPFPTNASYSILEYDGNSFKLISYSNDSHLGELSTPLFR